MPPARTLGRLLLLATLSGMAAAGMSACGGGDGAPASIGLSVSPGSLTVQQGNSGTVTVSISRANFDAPVSVAVSGLPSGVSASASPASLASGTTSAVVTVTATGSATPGTYTATVKGSATGVGDATATYTLTIVAPPDFSIGAAPAAVTVSSAASAPNTINIARTGGYAGAVNLTLTSAQAGITGVFQPASVAGNSTSLTISATNTVPLGSYPVTITGTGAGIGDRTTTIDVTVVAPPDYSLTASPNALTITAGTSDNSTITMARTGGFAGSVTLALTSAQQGITGVFTPPSSSGNSSALVVSVAASVPAGNYTATVTGTAAGQANRTTTLSITVGDAPRIALALGQPSLSVAVTSSSASNVTITRTNYAAAVTLAATGMPSGLAVTFSPSPTTATASTATIVVGGAVPVGSYPVTITASGAGVANAVATLTVVVAPASTEYRYCTGTTGTTQPPAWFAFQDGNGAWTPVLPTTSGVLTVFRFNVNAAVGGVTFIRASNGLVPTQYTTFTQYGTRDELIALAAAGACPSAPTGRDLSGSVFGVTPTQSISISMGGSSAFTMGSSAFPLTSVPLGPQTLIAGRADPAPGASAFFNRYVILRDLSQTTGQAIPFVDFNGANSVASVQASVTMLNTLGDQVAMLPGFYCQPGMFRFGSGSLVFTSSTVQSYFTVPDAQRRPGEFDEMQVLANQKTGQFGHSRSVFVEQTTPVQNFVMTFGAKLSATTLTVAATTPYPRARLQANLPAEYDKDVLLTMQPTNDVVTFGNSLFVTLTAAYRVAVATGSSIDVTMPDFSALAAFPIASAVPRGRTLLFTNAQGWTGGAVLAFSPGRIHTTASLSQDVVF